MSRLPSTLPAISIETVSASYINWDNISKDMSTNTDIVKSEIISSPVLVAVDVARGAAHNSETFVIIGTICKAVEDIRTKVRTWVDNLTQPVLVAA